MVDVYYVVHTESRHEDRRYPAYLHLAGNDGRMVQCNLYDASKFISKERAEKEARDAFEAFKHERGFDVIPVDKRIFGYEPRWLEI